MHTHDKEKDCEACKKLRLGLTWIGDPPKCRKHKKKPHITRYRS
jgi:hypothetical protein